MNGAGSLLGVSLLLVFSGCALKNGSNALDNHAPEPRSSGVALQAGGACFFYAAVSPQHGESPVPSSVEKIRALLPGGEGAPPAVGEIYKIVAPVEGGPALAAVTDHVVCPIGTMFSGLDNAENPANERMTVAALCCGTITATASPVSSSGGVSDNESSPPPPESEVSKM